MGLVATKPVFGVSEKAIFKLDSSATQTGLKIEISPVGSLRAVLSKQNNNKGADQTARMCRLVCTCLVWKLTKTDFFGPRPIHIFILYTQFLSNLLVGFHLLAILYL